MLNLQWNINDKVFFKGFDSETSLRRTSLSLGRKDIFWSFLNESFAELSSSVKNISD